MAADIDAAMLGSLQTGMEIDGFRLLERMNPGATAHLFRVERVDGTHAAFPMVMKIPKVGRKQPSESIIGFETEAMILPALHGDHVPRFVASGDIVDTPHLVMEWVHGAGLAGIAAKAPLPAAQVAQLGAALADAVHALHQQNVIHHDLKPDNVIVRNDGSMVLLDFGFARHAHFPDLLAEEKFYAAGSAPYVSPEQLTGSRADPRSDIFAMGAIIYELATGQLPFGIPESVNQMKHRLWASPAPPRAHLSAIPPWLQEVILRCLDPDPATRYQAASHVAFDLRHPEQVQLTPRATRNARPGFMTQFRLWWYSRHERRARTRKPLVHISPSPVIMVAVDTSHPEDERHSALQWTARQLALLNLEFRMICVSVVRGMPGGEAGKVEDTPSGQQLVHKVRLRNWVEPLGLPPQRLSLHVIESGEPAATLLEFARGNNVDLIVIGAPAPGDAALAWWRSTASTVAANATCSVHVVRMPSRPREDWQAKPIDPHPN